MAISRGMNPTRPSVDAIEAWVRSAQAGDREAFTCLVQALQRDVRQFACARVTSADLVEEVVQATFITAFNKLHSYELRGTFLPWLIGIAVNRIRSEIRARLRYQSTGQETLESLLLRARLEQDETSVEAEALAAQRGQSLAECVERLPPRARAILHSRYDERREITDLARQFKQPARTLVATLFRLRAALRRCMETTRASA